MYNLRITKFSWLFLCILTSTFSAGLAQDLSQADEEYLRRIDSLWNNRQAMSSIYNEAELRKLGQNKVEVDENVLRERLKYLDARSPMDLQYNSVVRAYIDRFIRYSGSLGKLIGLGEYYYPMFEEKLDKYNIPLEMKHLAVVESRLNPRAVSPVGAKGLWQFMYGTGKMFNLGVDSYVDERFDPVRSTEAACKYLRDLYNMFGDWDLALAAYNSGPGNVQKAIRRSGGNRNYWEIRQYLPRETAGYVPSFIAANYIMSYAKAHNIKPEYPKYTYYNTDTVEIKRNVSFRELSNYLDISIEDLQNLNPMYNKGVVPYVPGKKYTLTIPKNKMVLFEQKKNLIYKIEEQNPILNSTAMSIITGGSTSSTSSSTPSVSTTPVAAKLGKAINHRVKAGESLEMIANMYSVSPDQIVSWNNMSSRIVMLGQNLVVYGGSAPQVKSRSTYTVKAGDNLFRIAKINNVSLNDLMKWNNITNPNSITVGRVLKIQ